MAPGAPDSPPERLSEALSGVRASVQPRDVEPRCWKCGRMLARLVTRPWVIDCPRCKARNPKP